MAIIFLRVLSIFLIIGIGYLSNKKGRIPTSASETLSFIVFSITTPCMLAGNIINQDFSEEMMIPIKEITIGTVLLFAIAILAGIIITKIFGLPNFGVSAAAIALSNTGFMGFPIVKSVFGDYYLFLMMIHNLLCNVVFFTVGVLLVNLGAEKNGQMNFSKTVKSMINPVIVMAIIAFILFLNDIPVPEWIADFLNIVGDATVPLSMLLVGVQLGESQIISLIKDRYLMIINIARLAVIPIISFLIFDLLPYSNDTKMTLTLATTFPTAVIVSVLAIQSHRDGVYAAKAVTLTSFFSILTLPIWVIFLSNYYIIG